MKRFWRHAAAVPHGDAWTVELDGRGLRTPARAQFVVPNEALARAVANEWDEAGDKVDARAMPFTGLANAAIDRIAPEPATMARNLAGYCETDLLYYRAEAPPALARRQEESWGPLLAWARSRYDVDFRITEAIAHVAQPQETVERLANAVAALDPFRLAALAPLVTIGGSLVATLALLERAVTAEEAWQAVSIDERWQLEKWGADAEAETALANRRRDFMAAGDFLKLL
jgi:chaperone required for assembly of F1-ATPase